MSRLISMCSVLAITLVAGSNSAAIAAPGATLTVGPLASVTDNNSKFIGTFGLRAVENGPGPSGSAQGDVVFELLSPGVSMCTVHGSSASVDFSDVGNEGGAQPGFECGRAFGQSVSIQNCKATIQAHGFQHSDNPEVNYLGPVTISVGFTKKPGVANEGMLDVTVDLPAGKVMVKGKITGPVAMSSCP